MWVATNSFSAVRYGLYDPYGKQTNFTRPYMYELFDLQNDQYELYNIFNRTREDPAGGKLLSTLDKLLKQFYSCKPGECNKL
eukprot:COSAG01_NODE_6239_length_3775_cov_1.900979_2_plen_82_part_00